MTSIPNELKFDWIPPSERDYSQTMLTGAFHDSIGTFEERGEYLSDLPDKVIQYELEVAATGKLMWRPWQQTGSCVGVGGARAYCTAQCGDVVLRGDSEAVIFPFPFATYGVGRDIGGMRRPGEGSFGSAQAKAVEQFGMLRWDDPQVPKPTFRGNWIIWSASQEKQWSHPSSWPVPRSEIEKTSMNHQMGTVTKVTSIEGLMQALAQGYGVTTASMFGTRPRVEGDVLLGRWNDSWAHQQSHAGYWRHPQHGLIFIIDNQWGDMHGKCPTLSPLGVEGSYWVLEKDVAKILNNGEVYAHSATEGFPVKKFDFSNWSFSS